ncbi:MAG: RdgB/HAM1 family non-canonical purine NTP pyrophosphatase [Actinomycetota bacterium]
MTDRSSGEGQETTLPQLVCASANPDKVAEIALVLDGLVDLLPRPAELADVVEDAPDLEGNARLKAAAVCAAAGAAAVSDDTGLEVDALGGAPGVISARYAGENVTYQDNVDKLLAELERVGATVPDQRTARFRTVVMVVWPDGRELAVEGSVEGVIAAAPRGDGGFGYDPVFIPVERDGRSFAEMGDEKHEISHRGRAFRALADALRTERPNG